jgi:hypothetical protein
MRRHSSRRQRQRTERQSRDGGRVVLAADVVEGRLDAGQAGATARQAFAKRINRRKRTSRPGCCRCTLAAPSPAQCTLRYRRARPRLRRERKIHAKVQPFTRRQLHAPSPSCGRERVAFCTLQLEPKVWVVPMEIEIWARAQLSSKRRAKRVNECRVLLGRLIVLSRSFKQGPSGACAPEFQSRDLPARRRGKQTAWPFEGSLLYGISGRNSEAGWRARPNS